jgi:hypothetical protein
LSCCCAHCSGVGTVPASMPVTWGSTRRDRRTGVLCLGCGTPSASTGRVSGVSPGGSVVSISGAVVGSACSALLGVLVVPYRCAGWFVRCVSLSSGTIHKVGRFQWCPDPICSKQGARTHTNHPWLSGAWARVGVYKAMGVRGQPVRQAGVPRPDRSKQLFLGGERWVCLAELSALSQVRGRAVVGRGGEACALAEG